MPDRPSRFEAIALEVAEPLRRYAVRRSDPDTAQDVVADALLVIWRRLDDVPEVNALPWCYAVIKLCLANANRAQRRQRGLIGRIARLDPPTVDGPALALDADVELHEALGRLSETDRELLRLWAWEALTPADIAAVLGISTNAASIRLHRARKRLASELGPRDGNVRGVAGQEKVQEGKTP